MSIEDSRARSVAEGVLGTHTSPGSMVDKPALSQRTMSQLEDHAAAVDELHEEIDRCHQTIENLTKSTAFLRRQLADNKRR